jgi:hypothetical protein
MIFFCSHQGRQKLLFLHYFPANKNSLPWEAILSPSKVTKMVEPSKIEFFAFANIKTLLHSNFFILECYNLQQ